MEETEIMAIQAIKTYLNKDVVLFNTGSTDSIKTLFCRVPDIKVVGVHHPSIYKYALPEN